MVANEALEFLERQGYDKNAARVLRDGRIAWLYRLMFTTSLLVADTESLSVGYDDRWCYEDRTTALAALNEWADNGADEPEGWFRHPSSGRRRPNGDPTNEYVRG